MEGGSHPTAALYGGSDISGTIGGTAQVVMTDGTVGMVYGGGNGNSTYDNVNYTIYSGETLVATGDYSAPQITDGLVQLDGGTVGDAGSAATANVVFGGGYGQLTRTTGSTTVNIGPATGVAGPYIYGAVYGGSALGEVNGTVVSVLNGHVYGSVYGGGLGDTTYFGVGHTNIAAKVNGNAVECTPVNGYASISRRWKAGDKIEVDFDMPVMKIAADERVKADEGCLAVQRGPLVYCAEQADNTNVDDIRLSATTSFNTMFDSTLLGGVVKIFGSTQKRGFTLIPYYAWDNREAGKMKVWLPLLDGESIPTNQRQTYLP